MRVCLRTTTERVGIFVRILLKKCTARPGRKLRNSNTKSPPRILIDQALSLPAPFPIRIPLAFLVRGIWGKTLNQINRLVISDFLTAFFKNIFNRKICLDDIRKGCKVNRPESP